MRRVKVMNLDVQSLTLGFSEVIAREAGRVPQHSPGVCHGHLRAMNKLYEPDTQSTFPCSNCVAGPLTQLPWTEPTPPPQCLQKPAAVPSEGGKNTGSAGLWSQVAEKGKSPCVLRLGPHVSPPLETAGLAKGNQKHNIL